MLLQLQKLTCECQDAPVPKSSSSDENGESPSPAAADAIDEVHEAFISKVLEIEAQVKLLVKLVMLLCRHRFMERHARYKLFPETPTGTKLAGITQPFFPCSFLSTIREQMHTTLDISVAFFGIDWPHLLRVARNLVQLVEGLLFAVREESFINVEDRPVAAAAAAATVAAATGAGIGPSPSSFEIDLIIPRYDCAFQMPQGKG